MDRVRHVLALAALSLAATGALAQAPDALQARNWAAACANCHGTNGNAQGGVALAGMSRDEMVQKMIAFKNGSRPATIMHQLAKGYSDEQIAAIAGYFAAQRRAP
ncbi:MAG: c-type cytochrome [Ramlibacter sp.]